MACRLARLDRQFGDDGSQSLRLPHRFRASLPGRPCPQDTVHAHQGPYLSHRNLKSHIAWSRRLACQRSRSAQGSEYRHRWKARERAGDAPHISCSRYLMPKACHKRENILQNNDLKWRSRRQACQCCPGRHAESCFTGRFVAICQHIYGACYFSLLNQYLETSPLQDNPARGGGKLRHLRKNTR